MLGSHVLVKAAFGLKHFHASFFGAFKDPIRGILLLELLVELGDFLNLFLLGFG